jgi:hypothetical protein
VYLDLIGLLPTPGEQEAFLADTSAEALARVVDDLLARPQYGERWGRHWLDVVRYAETNGYERDGDKPSAWRYRDYVIRSFNADKPYDQFLIEQLAGDELDYPTAETQIATTFLRLGPWDDEPADPLTDRYDQLDDVLGATTAAFMGLTLRCARCHDHKFEPLTQRDYSRVLAVFEPLQRAGQGRDDGDREVGSPLELASYRQAVGRVASVESQLDELESQVCRAALAAGTLPPSAGQPPAAPLPPPAAMAAMAVTPAQRNDQQKQLVHEHLAQLRPLLRAVAGAGELAGLDALDRQLRQAVELRPAAPARAHIFVEAAGEPPPTRLFDRGDPRQPKDVVPPGVPAILVDAPPAPPERRPQSSGRRLHFARWLASGDHPLTARVLVNRIWQHHFGEGLVATENDFGVMGTPPVHARLLDYLASELVERGWSIKHLHRLLVLSSTYQMSSAANEAAQNLDPENTLVWRFRPRRLEAETIRDTILMASGRLNLEHGGPSFYPVVERAVLETQSRPGNGWRSSPADQTARRSVYIFVKRTLLVPELELLDLPCPDQPCEQRQVSTTAPQALTMLNGAFLHEQAAALAGRLLREDPASAVGRIELAFRLALGRPPLPEEQAAVAEFLHRQEAQIVADAQAAGRAAPQASEQALAGFCLVLLNGNEMAYLR